MKVEDLKGKTLVAVERIGDVEILFALESGEWARICGT